MEEERNHPTLLDLFANYSGLQINRTKSAFLEFGLAREKELQCLEARL